MQRAVSIPNVGDPGELVELARDVERAGWDGFFLWDHVQIYAAAEFDVVDPWMVLAAVAQETERLRIGPMATTPSRRRPWQLGKQIVTLDHAGQRYTVHAHLHPSSVQSPRPPIWIAATPPHRKPLERAARWDGVVCNVKLEDDLMPMRPEELQDYVGDFLEDPERQVVTAAHPEHAPEEYEAVGVSWLMDSWWPGPDWLAEFRRSLGLA